MSMYQVIPHSRQPGYKVEVITNTGTRHTILGFETEAEAVSWVEADKRREKALLAVLAMDDAAD